MIVAAAAAGLGAGCAKPQPMGLLDEAHRSALTLIDSHRAAEFDDASAQVFPDEGLVCGTKVRVRGGLGGDAGYQRVYFSRSRGAALEGVSASWIPFANGCIRAIKHRIAETDRLLAARSAGS